MMIDKYSVFGNPSSRPQKPTDTIKRKVIAACEPLIERLKKQITPIPEEQIGNHLVDIYGKWYRNQYHIYLVFQCPPNSLKEKFDSGLARLGWTGGDTFIASNTCHVGYLSGTHLLWRGRRAHDTLSYPNVSYLFA